jgi:hypothetical protein
VKVVSRPVLAPLAQIFDLFGEDDQLNVYAGELDVRPPGAPTTQSRWWPDRGGALPLGKHFATTRY